MRFLRSLLHINSNIIIFAELKLKENTKNETPHSKMGANNYINKSDIYRAAADLLHNKDKYPAVPHCAYYSCFLYIQHIWYNKFSKTEADITTEIAQNKQGRHEVLINCVEKHLINNKTQGFRDFGNKIGQLKKLRVEADYKDMLIDINKSKSSIELARDILPILKKI